jgi:hypothetical protein
MQGYPKIRRNNPRRLITGFAVVFVFALIDDSPTPDFAVSGSTTLCFVRFEPSVSVRRCCNEPMGMFPSRSRSLRPLINSICFESISDCCVNLLPPTGRATLHA